MGNLGWAEIMIVLVIALIVFGPRKLPELGKTLGQSLAQFKRASEDFKRTWEAEVETEKRQLDMGRPPEPVVDYVPDHGVQSSSSEAAAGEVAGADSNAGAVTAEAAAVTEAVEPAAGVHAEAATVATETVAPTTKLDWA